jgi:hypothetical protein
MHILTWVGFGLIEHVPNTLYMETVSAEDIFLNFLIFSRSACLNQKSIKNGFDHLHRSISKIFSGNKKSRCIKCQRSMLVEIRLIILSNTNLLRHILHTISRFCTSRNSTHPFRVALDVTGGKFIDVTLKSFSIKSLVIL